MGSSRKVYAAAALAALLAAPAAAAPLKMWLQPNGSFGFDAASTTAAIGAGVATLPDSTFFSNPSGGAPLITVTTPSPIPGTSVNNATFSNPSTGTSTWTVGAQDRAYTDLWLVIQGHEYNNVQGGPTDSYYTQNHKIGLRIDPSDPRWAIVHPTGFPTVSYLAYFVGDLAQGETFDVPIEYVVAKALKVVSTNPTEYQFPKYHVNFVELAVVPEPSLLALLAAGGALLAIRKRRVPA
jgi:hypothetical protein